MIVEDAFKRDLIDAYSRIQLIKTFIVFVDPRKPIAPDAKNPIPMINKTIPMINMRVLICHAFSYTFRQAI